MVRTARKNFPLAGRNLEQNQIQFQCRPSAVTTSFGGGVTEERKERKRERERSRSSRIQGGQWRGFWVQQQLPGIRSVGVRDPASWSGSAVKRNKNVNICSNNERTNQRTQNH